MKQTNSAAQICPIPTVYFNHCRFLSCHVLCDGGTQVPEKRNKTVCSMNGMKPWLPLNSRTKVQNISYC